MVAGRAPTQLHANARQHGRESQVAATNGAAIGVDPKTAREQNVAAMPRWRFTTLEEVARLVALMASPRTTNVTRSNCPSPPSSTVQDDLTRAGQESTVTACREVEADPSD
jgi:NAD(P)-dependent dehydrogenase (short-subunit alcohol dehydrogenase family)